jgi:hypothetical protein
MKTKPKPKSPRARLIAEYRQRMKDRHPHGGYSTKFLEARLLNYLATLGPLPLSLLD